MACPAAAAAALGVWSSEPSLAISWASLYRVRAHTHIQVQGQHDIRTRWHCAPAAGCTQRHARALGHALGLTGAARGGSVRKRHAAEGFLQCRLGGMPQSNPRCSLLYTPNKRQGGPVIQQCWSPNLCRVYTTQHTMQHLSSHRLQPLPGASSDHNPEPGYLQIELGWKANTHLAMQAHMPMCVQVRMQPCVHATCSNSMDGFSGTSIAQTRPHTSLCMHAHTPVCEFAFKSKRRHACICTGTVLVGGRMEELAN